MPGATAHSHLPSRCFASPYAVSRGYKQEPSKSKNYEGRGWNSNSLRKVDTILGEELWNTPHCWHLSHHKEEEGHLIEHMLLHTCKIWSKQPALQQGPTTLDRKCT